MTAQALISPLPMFNGRDGLPLQNGYVYFGEPNQDPEQYPVTVYADEAMTIAVTQPVRTTAGYLYRNGAPLNVWIDGSCSIRVRDSGSVQVYALAEWTGVVDAAAAATTASAAAAAASATEAAASVDEGELVLAQTRAAMTAAQDARDALTSLALLYETAFSFDATIDETDQAVTLKEGDAVTQSSLNDYFAWSAAAMRKLEDGSMAWSDHNLILQSGDLANGAYSLTGLTRAVGYEGPTGELDAALLTTSASPAFLSNTLSGTKISSFPGNYFLCAWKVKYDATHRWAYIRIDSPATKRVYFDLQTGVVGTADAGITGGISRYDADGELLPSGWFLIYAYQTNSAASFIFDIGLSDADANPAVTVAKTLRVANPQTCYGVNPLAYLESEALAVYGAPYSWENGGRSLMLHGGAVYSSLYSEDLTNAAWTKTNCTPLLNAVGISGEPCSTLTATAADATCLQVTVSAGTVQTFQPYIRRKTGTGAIYITMDNGGTWTDITSLINSTTYTRVYLHGVLANPTIGFKLATSGDEIEVCHANNVKATYVSPPLTVYGVAITTNPITLVNTSIPVELADDKLLAYIDMNLVNDTALVGADWEAVTFTNSTNVNMVAGVKSTLNLQDGNVIVTEIPTDRTTYPMYSATSAGERIEATLNLGGTEDGNYCSINGEPTAVDYIRNITGLDRYSIGGNGAPMQFIRKLLIAATTLEDRDEVRTKHYQQGIRNSLYACAIVAGDSEFASLPLGTDMNRQPVVRVLKDYGNSALLGEFWIARSINPYDSELPTRLMQRNYVYDKVENTLVPVTNAAVAYQPTRWSSDLGGVYAIAVFRVPSGENAGRLVAVLQLEDSVSGTSADMDVNVYVMTNDMETDGYPAEGWTTPAKIFDASDVSSAYIIVSPGGDYVHLPANHPVAPNRVVIPFYLSGNRVGCVYTDDFGGAWTMGNILTVSAPGASEPTLATWPDGTIVMTMRAGNGSGDNRQWATSVDGGVNFVHEGTMPSIISSDCSASTVQLDPTGLLGLQGRIAMSHASLPFRKGFQIEFATDATMELSTDTDPIVPLNAIRYVGYTGACSLFGGWGLAVGFEYGYSSGNLDNSVGLMVVKM